MATATAPATGVPVEVIGVALDVEWFAQWVDFVYWEFGHLGLFHTLQGVTVIEPNHPTAPAPLRWSQTNPHPLEGYYEPGTSRIWISGQANVWEVLVHELGHHLQRRCGVLPDGTHPGKALLRLYGALTGRPESEWVEHMATDFRLSFFHADPFPASDAYFHAVAAAGGF